MKQSPFKLAIPEMSLKEVHEPFSSNCRGPIHEDRRLQIEELDEWRMHKPRTPDKLNLRLNELITFPNQLKVGDRVLLDAADPYIVATTSNEEIPLTVLSIFPFGTVEVSHPKFGTFKRGKPSLDYNKQFSGGNPSTNCSECRLHVVKRPLSLLQRKGRECYLPRVLPWKIIEPTYLEITIELCSTFHLQTVMTNYNDPGMVQFRLGRLVHQLSISEFVLEPLVPNGATYNPSHSKAYALLPYLRYLHAILAHTITGRRESTGVINTHDSYFLWCMSHGYIIDLAYFIALAIQHQTEQHRKGVISIGHYMSPQGISSMLSMMMVEKRRGTYPPQYRLTQSTEEEAYEDIPDDVPPQHEDPLTQPPPPSHLVHATASYTDISERLTRFEL
ncbi:hypothetical protein GOBAR_AA14864 [Gossypium barbadense]|uniref:Uncharacterized protein n=1 Tax=Gossypium barbadense TaxID=3634 RepID=A0A2P5XR71_GOSBA|nr:hypothetical protein GOBAR_AA14864 [Gossypium barbadense]